MLKISKGLSVIDQARVDDLDFQIGHLHHLKEKVLALTLEVANQEALVIDLMGLEGVKSHKTSKTRHGYRATVVQGTRVKYNEPGLKKALGAFLWRKVSKTVLDVNRLADLQAAGEVDIMVVAEHSEVLANKPYVRVSVSDDDT